MDRELADPLKICGVIPELPSHHFKMTTPYPPDLLGAELLRFGMPDTEHDRPEGGGLIVEYLPKGGTRARRMVLGFNELGMWLEGVCDACDTD